MRIQIKILYIDIMVTLVKIVPSKNFTKKYDAHFSDGTKTSFGDSSMEDYTQHKDLERRKAYRARHKKDLETNDPTRAGYLSYYLLWNTTSLKKNIELYKRMFNM
jgi:hypothetical protein